jgi:deoxyribonuclease (pyrimidine dimer)
MTRINVVPPVELTQQHLVAEYRELPRIFNLVRAAIERGEKPNDKRNPLAYTLGTGHCRFFYAKLGWLKERQRSLITEMLKRGYKPSFTDVEHLDEGIGPEWRGDWFPDPAALAVNRARISIRLTEQLARAG